MKLLEINDLRIVPVVGPYGSGKSTLIKNLLAMYPDIYRLHISNTSRAPKPGDMVGEYRYRSKSTLRRWQREGKTVWPLAKAAGNLYASLRRDLELMVEDRPRVYLTVVVPETAVQYFDLLTGQVLPLWVDAPKSVLPSRLIGRGDTEEDAARRLSEYDRWHNAFQQATIPYQLIVNDGSPLETAKKAHELIQRYPIHLASS